MVVKNAYGVSAVIDPKILGAMPENEFVGSAIDRKKFPKKEKDFIKELLKIPLTDNPHVVRLVENVYKLLPTYLLVNWKIFWKLIRENI